jgi:hypothetical protein
MIAPGLRSGSQQKRSHTVTVDRAWDRSLYASKMLLLPRPTPGSHTWGMAIELAYITIIVRLRQEEVKNVLEPMVGRCSSAVDPVRQYAVNRLLSYSCALCGIISLAAPGGCAPAMRRVP